MDLRMKIIPGEDRAENGFPPRGTPHDRIEAISRTPRRVALESIMPNDFGDNLVPAYGSAVSVPVQKTRVTKPVAPAEVAGRGRPGAAPGTALPGRIDAHMKVGRRCPKRLNQESLAQSSVRPDPPMKVDPRT